MDDSISRRKLLALLHKHALAIPALGSWLPSCAVEQLAEVKSMGDGNSVGVSKNDKFMLYIHFGSADGLTTSMLPPPEIVVDGNDSSLPKIGAWPRGLFEHDKVAESINPNVNLHYKDQGKHLIFNEYSKVLQPMQDSICMAVGNARSLSHHDAAAFQITGGRFGNNKGSWVTNLAQALRGSDDFVNVVAATSTASVREAVYAAIFSDTGYRNRNVALINAASLDEASTILADPTGIPHAEGDAKQFWQTLQSINDGGGGKYADLRQSIGYYVANLVAGAPELMAGSALRSGIEAALHLDAVKAALNDSSLPGGAVCDVAGEMLASKAVSQLIANLQLAAGLVGGKRAKGMLFSYGDHDTHGGGSSSHTPRHASILFAAVRIFWEWVVAQGRQDDVMVVISHDFTRTTYNSKSRGSHNLQVRQATGVNAASLTTKGTDHQQIMSMMFINNNVPAAGRIGAITDNYTAFGSQNAQGIADTDIAPYTSDTLIGAMLMRCFSDVFKDEAAVQEFFPAFKMPSPNPLAV